MQYSAKKLICTGEVLLKRLSHKESTICQFFYTYPSLYTKILSLPRRHFCVCSMWSLSDNIRLYKYRTRILFYGVRIHFRLVALFKKNLVQIVDLPLDTYICNRNASASIVKNSTPSLENLEYCIADIRAWVTQHLLKLDDGKTDVIYW